MTSRLTYRTPDPETLAAYARDHRVDAAAPIQAAGEVVIDAPPARVWEVLTDVPRWHEVLEKGVTNIELPDGVRVGSRMSRTQAGFRTRAQFEVVDREHELAWTGTVLGVWVVHRFELTPSAAGTRVRCEESMGGRPFAVLASQPKVQAAMDQSLAMLKAACER